jgi:hypothetical protein
MQVARDQGVREAPLEAHDLPSIPLQARLARPARPQLLAPPDEQAELPLQRITRAPAPPGDPVTEIVNGYRAHLSSDDEAKPWFVENASRHEARPRVG